MKCTADSKFKKTCLAVVFLLSATAGYSSFEPLPLGGRPAGMGEAYSAIADDVFSLYYNPAGVMQMNRPEIGTYYSRLFMGLSDNSQISRMFLGYAQPLGNSGKLGSAGISYFALDLPGLYKEEGYGLTYGREFKHLLNLGGTVKMLSKKIGSDEYSDNAINPVTGKATNSPDPLLASGRSASAVGLDLGFQYRLSRAYALGGCARNINAPDVALGSTADRAPAVYTAALARKMRTGSLDLEVLQWKGTENNVRFMLGGEKWFSNGFGLRAGGGVGSRNFSSLSFGASYKLESLQLDYASVLPLEGVQGTMGMQQISLIVRLGKPPVDPLEQQLIREKEERIRAETEARYAKAERDRLKAQLYALTEEKSKEDKNRSEEAAQKALKEAESQKAKYNREAPATNVDTGGRREIVNQYADALAEYNRRVRAGGTLKEKQEMLREIILKFKESGVDISTVDRELKSLNVDEARAKKDFDLSMNFYKRLVQQGASTDDRRGMLKRIIEKYKGTGIDIKPAQDELDSLK